MAKQTLLWTLVPFGKVRDGGPNDGLWRVSVVVSPRLTPESASEQTLDAFPAWLDWTETLSRARFGLALGGATSALVPLNEPESGLWRSLFSPDTPVAGFQFKDMSTANWFAYPLRNVLGFMRRHYGRLAVDAAGEHPRLLPWDNADPALKDMLTGLGTRTHKFPVSDRNVELMLPGFSRFFDEKTEKLLRETVFGEDGIYATEVTAPGAEEGRLPETTGTAPVRAMSPDWSDPSGGGPDAAIMQQFSGPDEYTFFMADRFYRRSKAKYSRIPDFRNIDPPPKAPEYDFHRIVASFANYPTLLRRLGLVMDFAIEDRALIDDRIAAGGGEGSGHCRLKIEWDGPPPGEDSRPATAWLARKERFVPRPRSSGFDAGLLRLEHSNDGWNIAHREQKGLFDLYQVDPDGAALKTVDYTLTAQNLLGRSLDPERKFGAVTYTTGDRQPVAALRSGGIGVSLHGRAQNVVANAAAAKLKNQAIEAGDDDNVVMFAEDLQRGFRVDVAEVPDTISPGKWMSLCARTGQWRLVESGDVLEGMPDDEGYVSGASTTSSGEDDDHYLHETLFRWHGWSLVAERPGRTLKAETNEDDHLQAEVPTVVDDVAENGNGLAVQFRPVKGSLPKLRFGHLYRLRARTVDLAGNSLAVDDPFVEPLEQASDAIGYWRFEPVDPPVMVNRARLSEGESLERMVIRSNFDQDAMGYLSTPDFVTAIDGQASADFEYTAVNERHVVPPKSSQQQCETHGLFDPFFDDWENIRKAYAIAAREAGSLYDETPSAEVELVTPGAVSGVATSTELPIRLPDAANPVGDRTTGGQYVVHREAFVETPYLPDGAAGGVAIRAVKGHALPGVSGPMDLGDGCEVIKAPNGELVLMVPHGADWPFSEGFRLLLAERPQSHDELPCKVSFADDAEPGWNSSERTLTLFVAKGQVVRLRYASYVDKAYVDDFGIPNWTDSGEEAGFVKDSAITGTNWLMTPFRNLVLVHATQQPVCLPELEHLTPRRGLGDLHTDLLCRIVRLHGPSTGKFEIEAEWDEWVDDINENGPKRVTSKGQLGEVRLSENHVNEFFLKSAVDAHMVDPDAARGDRQEFGDTRFRLVRYRARASTRFREYLPPPLYDDPEKVSRVGPVAQGPAMSLPDPEDPGAPVLRADDGSTDQSLVPASAAPKDPRVLYTVPTFRWGDRPASGEIHDVTRLGNGLRVWLDRPWFSSGDGELLGVVIFGENRAFTEIPAACQALVTQWGRDPLWASAAPRSTAREADFTASVVAENLKLQELPGEKHPTVRIIGHRVHWDPERSLWYCDIELEAGVSYMPFVRLALVRYQPHGLPGHRVSKVVLAEFAQVLPRRRLRVTGDDGKVSVRLFGPNPTEGPMKFDRDSAFQGVSIPGHLGELGRNRVEVVLQEQEDGIESDLGWHDVAVLANHVVGTDDAGPGTGVRPGLSFDVLSGRTISADDDERGRTVVRRAGGRVVLPDVIDRGELDLGTRFPIDPVFWSAEFDLPDGNGKRRLLVREFERFYSDNTAPERTTIGVRPRRIIEERLVFADVVSIKTV